MEEVQFPLSDILEDSQEFEIMKNAARNGNPSAQHSIGMWYENVAKDLEMAKIWYKRAADQGHEGAMEAYNNVLQSKNNEV